MCPFVVKFFVCFGLNGGNDGSGTKIFCGDRQINRTFWDALDGMGWVDRFKFVPFLLDFSHVYVSLEGGGLVLRVVLLE